MDITNVMPEVKAAAKRAAAAKAKAEKAAMSSKGNLTFAQVQAMKKKGTFKGFDGMKGQTGPEAKLKGK